MADPAGNDSFEDVSDLRASVYFDDTIPLPRGRQFVTIEDAGSYITKLPKAEHAAAEWQTAMEALIPAAESGGPSMLARIFVMH
jgi:hypothetical protein